MTREEKLKKMKEYQVKNREKIAARKKQYYIDNPEKLKENYAKVAIWREKNKEYLKIHKANYAKKDRQENPEKYAASAAKDYQKRKKEINEYRKDRYKNNIQYKLSEILRKRLRDTVSKKYDSALDYVGCSLKQLEIHLENLFEKGMSWENYGMYGWHIDHIIPCKHFDLTDLEEQKKCFHYTNLQPLWAKDNLQKNAKLDWKK